MGYEEGGVDDQGEVAGGGILNLVALLGGEGGEKKKLKMGAGLVLTYRKTLRGDKKKTMR